MRNHLLFGAALLISVSASAQQQKKLAASMASVARDKYMMAHSADPIGSAPVAGPATPGQTQSAARTSTATPLNIIWTPVCQSMNALGCLVTESRPVQYNEDLDAVS